MTPYYALKSIGQFAPGNMLDVGARDLAISRLFAESGYRVHAIDPKPIESLKLCDQVSFERTTLEEYRTESAFDLVVASYVSQFVTYDLHGFLSRLKSLTDRNGLIYVTLIGDRDGWAEQAWSKAIDLASAQDLAAGLELDIRYQADETFDGSLYNGTPKYWHLLKFIFAQKSETL